MRAFTYLISSPYYDGIQLLLGEASANSAEALAMEEHKHTIIVSEVEKGDTEASKQQETPC